MAVALFVSFEKVITEMEASVMDGKVLAAHVFTLDEVARKKNLRTLSELVSESKEELDDFIGDENDQKSLDRDKKWARQHYGSFSSIYWGLRGIDVILRMLRWMRPFHREQWFEAAVGLESVRVLIAHVRDNSGDFGNDYDWLLKDLENLERFLAAANKKQVRFHLSYDI
jgi:hypothetical protein